MPANTNSLSSLPIQVAFLATVLEHGVINKRAEEIGQRMGENTTPWYNCRLSSVLVDAFHLFMKLDCAKRWQLMMKITCSPKLCGDAPPWPP